MRGRKPTPTALKLIRGNPGRRPVNKSEPKPAANLPECPDHLNDEARREWMRIAGELHTIGLLTSVDRAALAAYCDAYATWAEAKRLMKAPGESLIVATPNGGVQQNPLLGVANRSMEIMHRFLVEFGLTPSSRARVGAASKKPEADPLDDFIGKKRA